MCLPPKLDVIDELDMLGISNHSNSTHDLNSWLLLIVQGLDFVGYRRCLEAAAAKREVHNLKADLMPK